MKLGNTLGYKRNIEICRTATLEEGCCSDTMTCTRGCSYSFMYSWWWGRWTPETCKVILQVNKYLYIVASCWLWSI